MKKKVKFHQVDIETEGLNEHWGNHLGFEPVILGDDGSVAEELLSGVSELEERQRVIDKAVKEGYFTREEATKLYLPDLDLINELIEDLRNGL